MKVYYLYDGKQEHGPYSVEELKDKSLTANSLVWTDQLNDWTKAGDIAELKPLFTQPASKAKGIPPPPKQYQSKPSNSNNGLRRFVTVAVLAVFIIAAGFFMLRPKTSQPVKVAEAVIAQEPKLEPVKTIVTEPLPIVTPVKKEVVKAPVKKAAVVVTKDKINPAKFIEKNIKIRKNFVGQTIIEGTITNTSPTGIYKDVVLNVEYLSKTGSTISTQKFVVYEIAKPNKRIPFKFKTKAPFGTFSFASEVVDATPLN